MGFTIEDMMVISKDNYKMKMIAGDNGWSNSIRWIMMIEDSTILKHFSGKELAVTTGLGFSTEEDLLELVRTLSSRHSSGLVINTGCYVMDVPESVICLCNDLVLPLLIVPWEINISDMIKDLTLSIYQQEKMDSEISQALIEAIEHPAAEDTYVNALLPYFDVDGTFQTVLISTGNLDSMDTVDRRRLSYRLHLYLENITHNGNFFYYNSYFVLIMNAVSRKESLDIIEGFKERVMRRISEIPFYIGVGSVVHDVRNLHHGFRRAEAAFNLAYKNKERIMYFDEMDVNRLFYSMDDKKLLEEMSIGLLSPLIEYDEKHNTNYVEMLELFLKYNGSIQTISELSYTHRNTVIYRLNNIKNMLYCDFKEPEDRIRYLMACLIYHTIA